jgi:hypothetical protein
MGFIYKRKEGAEQVKRYRSTGYVLLVVMISLIGGCASTGPSFKGITDVPQGKGLVYVYRPSMGFVGSILSFDVYAGADNIGHLYPGGYLSYFANPGELEIWAKTESKSSVTIDVKAGEIQYVKANVTVGVIVGRPLLNVVEPMIGQKQIADCKQNASK